MDFQHRPVEQIPDFSPEELERLLEFIEYYRLELHDPSLRHQADLLLEGHLQNLKSLTWKNLQRQLAPYLRFHREYPYLLAPSQMFSEGEYVLGRQVGNGAEIRFRQKQFALHFLVVGATDVGKTSLCQGLLRQGLSRGLKVVVFDGKDDYQFLACHDPDCLVLGSSARLNILQKPSYLTLEEHIFLFIDCFKKAFFSAELTAQILWQSLTAVYQQSSHPSLEDLQRYVDSLYRPRDTFTRQNSVQGTSARILRMQACFPTAYQTHEGISFDELFKHSICIPVKSLSNEVHKFFFTYLVQHLFAHNRYHRIRDTVTHIIYTDEGYEIWTEDQTNIEGVPLLSSLQSQVREFSLGFTITTTNYSKLHPLTRSNTNCFLCLNVVDPKDVDAITATFNLSKEQRCYLLERIVKGQFLAKFASGSWPYAILCQFDPLPYAKTVSSTEWMEAQERINKYAPPELPAKIEISREKAPKPAMPSPPPPASKPTLKLSANEDRLLRVLCQELLPATEAYRRAGMPAQQGTTAQKRLHAMGLLEPHPVLVKPGRGGKAVVLFPTRQAFDLLSLKPGKGTRGGDSRQHEYLARSIAAALPGSQLEFILNGKAIDVFLIYQESLHRSFFETLRNVFHMENIVFSEGQSVAVECECSDPVTTGPENASKNASVGISLTVLACLPGHEARTARALQGALEGNPGVFVVDALKLLHALKAYDQGRAS